MPRENQNPFNRPTSDATDVRRNQALRDPFDALEDNYWHAAFPSMEAAAAAAYDSDRGRKHWLSKLDVLTRKVEDSVLLLFAGSAYLRMHPMTEALPLGFSVVGEDAARAEPISEEGKPLKLAIYVPSPKGILGAKPPVTDDYIGYENPDEGWQWAYKVQTDDEVAKTGKAKGETAWSGVKRPFLDNFVHPEVQAVGGVYQPKSATELVEPRLDLPVGAWRVVCLHTTSPNAQQIGLWEYPIADQATMQQVIDAQNMGGLLEAGASALRAVIEPHEITRHEYVHKVVPQSQLMAERVASIIWAAQTKVS